MLALARDTERIVNSVARKGRQEEGRGKKGEGKGGIASYASVAKQTKMGPEEVRGRKGPWPTAMKGAGGGDGTKARKRGEKERESIYRVWG